jgi:hypothetical protein
MISNSTLYRRPGYKAPPWRLGTLLLICLYLSNQLVAQVQGGQFHLGGQFTFRSQRLFSTTIQPEIGLMLSPRWSLGVSLPVQYITFTNSKHSYQLGIGPFIRNYIDLKSGFYGIIHAQATGRFNFAENSGTNPSIEVQLSPSISYFFSSRFALEAGFAEFSYLFTHIKSSNLDFNIRTHKLELRAIPIFSLRYYLPHPAASKQSSTQN